MDRAHRVRDGALEVRALILEDLGGVDDVADVVERVKHAEDVDAVAVRGAQEVVDDLLGVMLVAHKVLAAGEHRERRVGAVLLDGAEALPGVLVQETQARVERRSSPRLDGPVADLVHLRQDRKHVPYRHARGPQRLLTVADGGVLNKQWPHRASFSKLAPFTRHIELPL